MHPKDVIEQHEFREHMRVRLNNGKTYDTEHMTVTPTTVTIYRLRDGDTLAKPMVIRMIDVDTIERFQYDKSNSIATTIVIAVPIVFISIFLAILSTWD